MNELLFNADCPTRKVLEDISKKWTMLVLYSVADDQLRFSDILRTVEGISQKVLTQTLRHLERDGLIQRTVDAQTVPISVRYNLTELGKTLSTPLSHIREWSQGHADEVAVAQRRYDERQ
jgi:DNA-binding HxlR family transcriptional regulator